MAEPLLSFTHLLAVFGLALLYCILLNTKPTVTAGGAAAATSKRFAIVRAKGFLYLPSEVPEDLNQCLTSRWKAGPDWCQGSVCKLRTATVCVYSGNCIFLKQQEEHAKYLKQQKEHVDPTFFHPGSQDMVSHPFIRGSHPPVNEMLEWVEDCGWTLHSASSATRLRNEMYVFARPKL